MVQSFKYTFISLKNTKGFLISMTIMPIIMILLISITLAYSTTPMVGYIGNSDLIERLDGIRIQRLEKKDIDYFLGSSQGNLILELDNSGKIKKYYSSLEKNPLISQIETQMKSPSETRYKEKIKIEYSIGIILGKLLTAGSLLGTILIQEKNSNIFVRIKNAKTSFYSYIFGKILSVIFVYEIANIIILAFYYFAGFDFGKSNIMEIFILFTSTLIISTGIYTFLASVVKNEGFLWVFSTGVVFPLGLCSGILFPIEYIPDWMKVIAHITPQYYMQKSFVSGEIDIVSISLISIIGVFLTVFGIKNILRRR